MLSDTSDKSVVNKYRLHSVLVHSGGSCGGRYSAFIKSDGKWYSFEDEFVNEETAERAISEQFGLLLSSLVTECTLNMVVWLAGENAKQSTAYVLVYIRVSDWDRIICECGKEDISEPIRRRFEVVPTRYLPSL